MLISIVVSLLPQLLQEKGQGGLPSSAASKGPVGTSYFWHSVNHTQVPLPHRGLQSKGHFALYIVLGL